MPIETTHFDVTGMSCTACAAHIEKAIGKLPGMQLVQVNLLANSMATRYDGTVLTAGQIADAVQRAGYGATPRQAAKPAKPAEQGNPSFHREMQSMLRRFIVSLCFALPLLAISMGPMLGLPLPGFLAGSANALSLALSQFLLALPVALVNHKYFTGGFRALRYATPNMDSLVALGACAALAYGLFALYRIGWGLGHGQPAVVHHYLHNLYFESAATILMLITLGKMLEAISKGRTGKAIGALLNLAPKTALLLRDGTELEVPIEQLQVGDVLAIKPGARVPADGTVLEGHSAVDESALTGESLPVEKLPGSSVTGATVNTTGYFTMRAEGLGDNSVLAQIVALVQEAGASKAPIARLADKISGVFVPVVMGIALLSFIVWLALGMGAEFALARAITVLVISCPCALGLATPVAIMVGTGVGAKNAVLYRSAEALETLGKVDTIVLDKTGTITQGRPALVGIYRCDDAEESEDGGLLALAATLEAKSEHPVAKAILDAAEARGPLESSPPQNGEHFQAFPGLGVQATVNGAVCLAGNARLMREQNIPLAGAHTLPQRLSAEGKTPLYLARGGRLVGILAVADPPRPGSAAALAALRARGLATVMLTGDNSATAQAVGRLVGAEHVVAEVLPADKDAEIRRLMAEGHTVAMVGDGINDAPALARANVGLAIGAGTDVAIESAGVVLMKSDLAGIVTAYRLSKAVLRNIRQNLFWAFIYNIVGIPIAAGVFYFIASGLVLSPMLGAAAMSLSSLFVVSNALRLNWFKPKLIFKEDSPMEKIIHIEGMSCAHCAVRVEQALNVLPGVSATVQLKQSIATVKTSGDVTNQQLAGSITEAGYTVTSIT